MSWERTLESSSADIEDGYAVPVKTSTPVKGKRSHSEASEDEQDDSYAVPLQSAPVIKYVGEVEVPVFDSAGYTQPLINSKEVVMVPLRGEDGYTIPNKKKTKNSRNGVQLRGGPSAVPMRSASLEDVSGSPIVSAPVRASMPPDAFSNDFENPSPSISPSSPPATLSSSQSMKPLASTGDRLQHLPTSTQSMNKLQVHTHTHTHNYNYILVSAYINFITISP